MCALAALATGEQHPLLTVIADHSVALLEVIRAMVDDIDRSARPSRRRIRPARRRRRRTDAPPGSNGHIRRVKTRYRGDSGHSRRVSTAAPQVVPSRS